MQSISFNLWPVNASFVVFFLPEKIHVNKPFLSAHKLVTIWICQFLLKIAALLAIHIKTLYEHELSIVTFPRWRRSTIQFFWEHFDKKIMSLKMFWNNAPVNKMPGGGGGGEGRQGIGWGLDFFRKFAIKFQGHGQITPVKCNQISPPQAAHCCQSQGRT